MIADPNNCYGPEAAVAGCACLRSTLESRRSQKNTAFLVYRRPRRARGDYETYLDVTSSGDPFGAPLPSSTDASPHRGFVHTIADAPARITCVRHCCGVVALHLQKTGLAGLAGRAANCVRSNCSSLVCKCEGSWRRVDCPQMVFWREG